MSDTPTQDPPAPDPSTPPADPPRPEDELGEKGKRALDAERDARKAAERAAKTAQDELDKLRKEHMSESEKALEQARQEGRLEAAKAANAQIVLAEVKAAAAGKLADPADAPRLLELNDFAVDANGEVNSEAIAKAIDALVEKKPYLAATAPKGGPAPGAADGGHRGASQPPQLTQEDLKGMKPAEIVKARAEGRLNRLQGLD